MTAHELKDLLDEVSPYLKPSIEVDKDNEVVKRFIKAYKEITGKTTGAGNCKNCVLDAFFEMRIKTKEQIEFITMEKKYKLKSTRVVGFNNSHYTLANITDEVSLQMVAFNRNHSNSFENGNELLADLDGLNSKDVKGLDIGSVSETGENIYSGPQPKKRGQKRKG
tara:strand:- start:1664 stop:2161 length:498 start_codon:yes stop_codon:yes gene_type:complete